MKAQVKEDPVFEDIVDKAAVDSLPQLRYRFWDGLEDARLGIIRGIRNNMLSGDDYLCGYAVGYSHKFGFESEKKMREWQFAFTSGAADALLSYPRAPHTNPDYHTGYDVVQLMCETRKYERKAQLIPIKC